MFLRRIVSVLYLSAGLVSLLLGLAGIVLPLLPATPFLLLAAFCFGRGSRRFDEWFRRTGLYRK